MLFTLLAAFIVHAQPYHHYLLRYSFHGMLIHRPCFGMVILNRYVCTKIADKKERRLTMYRIMWLTRMVCGDIKIGQIMNYYDAIVE